MSTEGGIYENLHIGANRAPKRTEVTTGGVTDINKRRIATLSLIGVISLGLLSARIYIIDLRRDLAETEAALNDTQKELRKTESELDDPRGTLDEVRRERERVLRRLNETKKTVARLRGVADEQQEETFRVAAEADRVLERYSIIRISYRRVYRICVQSEGCSIPTEIRPPEEYPEPQELRPGNG